jgi:nicotinate phosphoribosyltransferase
MRPSDEALLTDLYELTMAASYFAHGMNEEATFDLFVRHLPNRRNFLIACGLEGALEYLENARFDDDAIEYLRGLEMFDEGFLDYLATISFGGKVWAVPEGEAVFPDEPLLRVTGPLIEAQIVETFLLNGILSETMMASKAARVAIACGEKQFVDFSLRRDHGTDAGLKAARASFVGGAAATSNVLAGKRYGIPVSGTMAHSYVMAFGDEIEAFRSFARTFPDRAVLLIDTLDVEEGARRAARVAQELEGEGVRLQGVRIDSGELGHLARSVRKILDDAGLDEVQIVLSGDLDEYRIAELLREGAPVDSFGVGTQLGTSGDAPSLGGVYKLVEYAGKPVAKFSAGKATTPGRKQIYRFERDGKYVRDLIALEDEPPLEGGRPLLKQALEGGRRTAATEPLYDLRQRCRRTIEALPRPLHSLRLSEPAYEVRSSDRLDDLRRTIGN